VPIVGRGKPFDRRPPSLPRLKVRGRMGLTQCPCRTIYQRRAPIASARRHPAGASSMFTDAQEVFVVQASRLPLGPHHILGSRDGCTTSLPKLGVEPGRGVRLQVTVRRRRSGRIAAFWADQVEQVDRVRNLPGLQSRPHKPVDRCQSGGQGCGPLRPQDTTILRTMSVRTYPADCWGPCECRKKPGWMADRAVSHHCERKNES